MKRWVVFFGFLIFLLQGFSLFAEDGKEIVMAKESHSSPALTASDEPDLTANLISRIIIYLVILCSVGIVVVYFFKQGKFVRGMRNSGNKLKICETHVLGNKQFLVVVEYEKQRVLLGVGPGMIKKLCFLDKPNLIDIEEDNKRKLKL